MATLLSLQNKDSRCFPYKHIFTNCDLWSPSAMVWMWFFCVTFCLNIVNICAKLFQSPSIHGEVGAQRNIILTNFDLLPICLTTPTYLFKEGCFSKLLMMLYISVKSPGKCEFFVISNPVNWNRGVTVINGAFIKILSA